MARATSVVSVSLTTDLFRAVEDLAETERRSRSELVRDALRTYVLQARWRRLREAASLHAVRRGFTPLDVERMVDEVRLAHRR